jgi:hypothetical protein
MTRSARLGFGSFPGQVNFGALVEGVVGKYAIGNADGVKARMAEPEALASGSFLHHAGMGRT